MGPFLAAQADFPFDPTAMLIHADWLEEQGDEIGAAVLRGLAKAGVTSLVAMAWGATLVSGVWHPDDFDFESGKLYGDGFTSWIPLENRRIMPGIRWHGSGMGDSHGQEGQFISGEGGGDGKSLDSAGDMDYDGWQSEG